MHQSGAYGITVLVLTLLCPNVQVGENDKMALKTCPQISILFICKIKIMSPTVELRVLRWDPVTSSLSIEQTVTQREQGTLITGRQPYAQPSAPVLATTFQTSLSLNNLCWLYLYTSQWERDPLNVPLSLLLVVMHLTSVLAEP